MLSSKSSLSFLGFCVLGIGVLFYSAHDWFQLMSGIRQSASFCAINAYWNCDRAAMSAFGSWWGLPTGIFGVLWFLGLGGIVLGRIGGRSLLILWSTLGVLAIAVMGGILFFVLKAGCLICIASYLCVLGSVTFAFRVNHQTTKAIFNPKKIAWSWAAAAIVLGLYAWRQEARLDGNFPQEELQAFVQSLPRVDMNALQSPMDFGDAAAKIQVAEFADFGCPYCARSAEILVPFLKLQSDTRVQFFPYPLDSECNSRMTRSAHPGSCQWSKVVLCAQKQSQHWVVHDLIFKWANQEGELPSFSQRRAELPLDQSALDACLVDPQTAETLQKMIEMAHKVGVDSTPTFVVNGRLLKGFLPLPLLRAVLKELTP